MFKRLTYICLFCFLIIIIPIIGLLESEYVEIVTTADNIATDLLKEDPFYIPENTRVLDKSGAIIGEIPVKNFRETKINDINQSLINSYIAIEDRKFKEHHGVDIEALGRASLALVKNNGDITQGGSTITQQLVKNVFLTSEKKFTRKFTEILAAIKVEKVMTKLEIMEAYLNTNFYGNNCYGINSAARYYFDKTPKDLTYDESVLLVAITNSPTKYNPKSNPKDARARRDFNLDLIADQGYITQEEADKYKSIDIVVKQAKLFNFNPENQGLLNYALYETAIQMLKEDKFEFTYVFESELEEDNYRGLYKEKYQEKIDIIRSGGFTIKTSFDMIKQQSIQNAIDSTVKGNIQAAVVVIDNKTGNVVNMVGGKSGSGEFNRAYQAIRQPGSSIKPLVVYGPAFDTGKYYPGKILVDKKQQNGPKNYNGKYLGKISIRKAIINSTNTIAYSLFADLGLEYTIPYLGNLRYSTLDYLDMNNYSIPVGGFTKGVTPLDLARSYTTVINNGNYIGSTGLSEVTKPDGNKLLLTADNHNVFKESTSYLLLDCMKDAAKQGTSSKLNSLGIATAAKTGTTNDNKDGWIVVITPFYTTVVWCGEDIPKSNINLYGATYPLQIYNKFTETLHNGLSQKEFDKSETVLYHQINKDGDLSLEGDSKDLISIDTLSLQKERLDREKLVKEDNEAERRLQSLINADYSSDLKYLKNQALKYANRISDVESKENKLLRINTLYKEKVIESIKVWIGDLVTVDSMKDPLVIKIQDRLKLCKSYEEFLYLEEEVKLALEGVFQREVEKKEEDKRKEDEENSTTSESENWDYMGE